MGVAALLDVWGGEAGRALNGGLRSYACSRTGWGRHHHHHSGGGDDGSDSIGDDGSHAELYTNAFKCQAGKHDNR